MKAKSESKERLRSHSGQAMAEFVILLTVIMILCAGMLYSSRLLTFHFWAQQEARYIAFEQTWVPHAFRGNPATEPITELNDDSYFHRPSIVGTLNSNKTMTDDGDVSGLLPYLVKKDTSDEEGADTPIHQTESAPIMLARNTSPWWSLKTKDWMKRVKGKTVSLVNTAFASQDLNHGNEGFEPSWLEDEDDLPQTNRYRIRDRNFERKFVRLLERVGFGEKFCNSSRKVLRKYKVISNPGGFFDDDCAERYDKEFGVHLAHNIDFKEYFRDYEYNLDWGHSNEEALQVTTESEMARQFYSFFNDMVNVAFLGAPVMITIEHGAEAGQLADSSMQRMAGDLRYVGSIVVLGLIDAAAVGIGLQDPVGLSRDADAQLALEEYVVGILHDRGAVTTAGYILNPTYLPAAIMFGKHAGGLQSGLMKNFLFHDDSGLVDTMVNNSNKASEVTYESGQGLFPAATRRWSDTNKELTSKFYLVTQPWHIPRRENNGTGAWRQKGNQFDSKSEETEEGMLRRRVLGMWLIPSDLGALLDPLVDLFPSQFGSVVGVFTSVLTVIGYVKDFITDNPFLDIADWLSELPIIGSIVPTLPKWPTVRPGAYPGSTELTGNSMSDPDRMTNRDRNFSDYVDEQREFNPEPNPTYN